MEIDFNPSRIPKPDRTQPAARPTDSPVVPKPSDSSAVTKDPAAGAPPASLQSKLDALPLIRPEKVAAASALVSDKNYPPGYIVDRIAVLLALHIKK
jgi:hypothetical protein